MNLRRHSFCALRVLAAAASAALITAPAGAQLTVYDPANHVQNVLVAARTLQQVNNQIRSLQNEATMLLNQAKNLTTISFPEVAAITERLQAIDRLMGEAKGIQFRVATTEQQVSQLFPTGIVSVPTAGSGAAAGAARLEASLAAYRQTMQVQSAIAESVSADAATLDAIAARSQSAVGALQVGQATNQLLALAAKQQSQLQAMMAAQYRADALAAAQRLQAQGDARGATRKFLGSGSAYSSPPPGR